MKRILSIVLSAGILISCSNNQKKSDKDSPKSDSKKSSETVEEMVKRHIESKLNIPSTEKYTYHIYKEYLDGDEKIDAIITVNRLNFAMDEASKSSKTAKNAELGFIGNYNYIFYYDGGLNMISPQIAIPSSPKSELKISFQNIQSPAYKDVLVDFKIMDGSFKDFYTIKDHIPSRFFQWKNYQGLGVSGPTEAFYFEYAEGTLGPLNDILVKKAVLIQPKQRVDIYAYDPEIKKTDELVYRFFYHPKTGKYMTQNK